MNRTQENDLLFALMRFARILARETNLALKQLGLTGEQVALLDAIETMSSPRNIDVGFALGLDHSSVSANIKPLLRQGLILTINQPTDRRTTIIELTREGREKLHSARAILSEVDNGLKQRLAENEAMISVIRAFDGLC